jgi:hypothetical protein
LVARARLDVDNGEVDVREEKEEGSANVWQRILVGKICVALDHDPHLRNRRPPGGGA